ncbi:hypothetical protein JHK82_043319 [Glycine max]|nr:hypothetical protein JHK82_043319 [Glycine max]
MRQLQASLGADEEGRRSVVDPAFRKAWLDQSLKTMMEIYVRCLVKELADRPSIEYVLWNLQFASQVQHAWRGHSQSSEGFFFLDDVTEFEISYLIKLDKLRNERQGLNDGSLGSMVSSDEVYEGLGILLEFGKSIKLIK